MADMSKGKSKIERARLDDNNVKSDDFVVVIENGKHVD